MARTKSNLVWVIRWEYSEYGGYSYSAGESYHLTREDAEAFKSQREGAPQDQNHRFFEDGYRYRGSEPSAEFVGKAEYKRIKALGHLGGFLGPKN